MNARETTASVMEPIRTRAREVLLPLQQTLTTQPAPGRVVFLCQSIPSRVVKLGRAARYAGYRPILVLLGDAWAGPTGQRDEFEQAHLVFQRFAYDNARGICGCSSAQRTGRQTASRLHRQLRASIRAQAPRLGQLYRYVDKFATAVTMGHERERTLQLFCEL